MKTILSLLLSVGAVMAAEPLGVLYYPSLDNLTSPAGLKVGTLSVETNIYVQPVITNRVLISNNEKGITYSALTTNQAFALSQIVGTNNLIFIGTPSLSSGSGAPTNGTAGIINGSLYFRTGGASINESLYVSLNTNWYSLATTNAGSITESQLNFSDVTTADTSTNEHGLAPKLSGIGTEFLSGLGLWTEVPSASGSLNNNDIPFYSGAEFFPSGLDYDAASQSITASTNFTVNGILNAKGTNTANYLTVTNWGGTTIGDVSTSVHGLVPVAPNDATKFLNGLGAWSIPAGGGGSVSTSGSPAVNQVSYFSGSSTITGDADFTFDGTTVTAGTLTAGNLSVTSNGGNILSGTYTPTRTAGTGSTTVGTTAYTSMYSRIGNIVTVQGRVQMARTSSGTIDFTISLPIASDLASVNDLYGQGNNIYYTAGLPTLEIGSVAIIADLVNNTAKFYLLGSSATGTLRDCHFTFTYQVH